MKKSIVYVILTFSILANVILVGRKLYYQYFYQPKSNKVQKTSSDYKQDIFRHCPYFTNEIVFLGNSLTSEFHLSEYFPNQHVKNRGIWGDKTSDMMNRINEIIDSGPKKIFLMAGINDLLKDIPNDQILRNIHEIVQKIRTESPETNIYIQSVLPVSPEVSLRFLQNEKIANSRILELNGSLSSLYHDDQIQFIDLHSAFALNGKLNADYSWDGVHINGKGYQLWFNLIREFVENKQEILLN